MIAGVGIARCGQVKRMGRDTAQRAKFLNILMSSFRCSVECKANKEYDLMQY